MQPAHRSIRTNVVRYVSPFAPRKLAQLSRSERRLERRARESNPQPLAGHLISNQTANHSLTLRNKRFYTFSAVARAAVQAVYASFPRKVIYRSLCGRASSPREASLAI